MRVLRQNSYKPLAEVQEEIAAGLTGLQCPFCHEHKAMINTLWDRRGILSQNWFCDHCDETGVVLGSELYWSPEGEASDLLVEASCG